MLAFGRTVRVSIVTPLMGGMAPWNGENTLNLICKIERVCERMRAYMNGCVCACVRVCMLKWECKCGCTEAKVIMVFSIMVFLVWPRIKAVCLILLIS